jgi:Rrf2 family protein
MFQVTKKVEYALMALSHMANGAPDAVVTVKDVAETYNIPAKLLAKVFHNLKRGGVVKSYQGKHGGYSLLVQPADLSMAAVMTLFGETRGIVSCVESDGTSCLQHDSCSIRATMETVGGRMWDLLGEVTIRDFVANRTPALPSEIR